MHKRRKILLDANFLIIPGQFGVDIFSELERVCGFRYELVTVPEVVKELEAISKSEKSSLKDRKAAGLALQLLRKYKVRTLHYRKVFKRGDEAILAVVDESTLVATQDRELRGKLREKGVRTIILRQKQYLKFFEE